MTETRVARADEDAFESAAAAMPWRSAILHRRRFELDRLGVAVYLIAWRGVEAIGHVLVRLDAASVSTRAREHGAEAEIQDLYVRPDARGGGAGSALMEHAEAAARANGAVTIGLGAGIDDGYAVARRIYAHRGYEIVSEVYWESWTTPDEHGVEHPGGDHLRYMVKRL